MIDSRDINELHPTLKRGAEEFIRRMNELGYPVGISSTYRDNEAQDKLYAQGRTEPGNIVTNAKGGESIHNYRLAFDVFKNISGEAYSDAQFFEDAGRIWKEMGGEWGGDWTSFQDRPHLQYTGGLTLLDLQNGKTLAQDAKMPWELAIEEEEEEKEEEEDEMRYNNLEEIPSWAKATIQKLVDANLLQGVNENGEQALDLTLDMIRMFVVNDRAGLYNNI